MRQHIENLSNAERLVGRQPGREDTHHIILVDAHLLMRLALQRVIATFERVQIEASLSTIDEVFQGLDTMMGYTIVLGPSITIADCLALVKCLRERKAQWRVVVIQHDLHPETARTLVEQGVQGLLDEDASEQDLAGAIAAVSRDQLFLSQRIRSLLMTAMSQAAGRWTRREVQVLSRLKYGESNFRIARVLGLKEKTIEKYLTSIYYKLNVRSRAEAILCLQKMHF